ncbi:MAG: hypothetical protein RLZZ387_677 [Chloroflexota bacterium]
MLAPRSHLYAVRVLLFAAALALLAACGGATPAASPTAAPEAEPTKIGRTEPTKIGRTEPAASGEATLVNATFARQLGESQEPVDPTEEFYPDEIIYLSLEFEGRPKEGVVASEFFWGEDSIASAEVNFADANSGVIFSIGESTFVSFNLTHETPLPISGNYRVEAMLDGEPLGTYTFAVVPPEDALKTKVSEVTLAKNVDENYNPIDPTTEFAQDEAVYLVGSGDLGQHSWLRVNWYVNGELDDVGTRDLGPFEENLEDAGFSFNFLPEGGWPEGEHEAVLIVNDEEVERYAFTVGAVAEEPAPSIGGEAALVEVSELESFTSPSGLFTIDVPAGWDYTDNSEGASETHSWTDATGTSGIIVSLYATADEQTEEQLTDLGTEFVTNVFGSEPEFEIIDTQAQSDGSVLVAWTATPDISGPVELVGLTYVEQREDKVSLLNALMPADQYEQLWEESFQTIVNSYRIDPSVMIGQ